MSDALSDCSFAHQLGQNIVVNAPIAFEEIVNVMTYAELDRRSESPRIRTCSVVWNSFRIEVYETMRSKQNRYF